MARRIRTGWSLLLSGAVACGCGQSASEKPANTDLEARKQEIVKTHSKVSPEAEARRSRSIALLKQAGVPTLDSLPMIETEQESTRRTSEEVAMRAMALAIVAAKAEGLEQEFVDQQVEKYQLAEVFTPQEAAFIKNPNTTENERTQLIWRYECCWVMLWALGFVETLEPPSAICDAGQTVRFLKDNGREGFLKKAKLRPQSELLDAADLIYRYHWAVVDARVNGKDSPGNVDGGVVMERHYALNWLIGYMDQDWDDISTDT